MFTRGEIHVYYLYMKGIQTNTYVRGILACFVSTVLVISVFAIAEVSSASNQVLVLMGRSPVTGEYEKITDIGENRFIKSPSFSTVYYVGNDGKRHPFANLQTYLSWANSLDAILTVTDATLPTLTVGAAMPPAPGVQLVKIRSIAEVYAVVDNPNDDYKPYLRHITSELLAMQMYGVNWADFVIDVEPGEFSSFTVSSDLFTKSDIVFDRALMKTRSELNGAIDGLDSDGDGLSDSEEARLGTSNSERDTDHDGLTDWEEVNLYGTDPRLHDTDGDMIGDGGETIGIYKTDPNKADTDSDGLLDGDEVSIGTDPLDYDSDNDGIYDKEEIYEFKTDPLNWDTDGDSLSDGGEVANGSDPLRK